MKKMYITPSAKVHTCSFGSLLGGSTGANLYNSDGQYSGSIGNGGGVGSNDENIPVPGAKQSYFSSWGDDLGE